MFSAALAGLALGAFGFAGDPLMRLRFLPCAHPDHALHRLGRELTLQDLRKHRIEHEEIVFPNEIHDLTRYASWITLFTATDAYLNRYLKK